MDDPSGTWRNNNHNRDGKGNRCGTRQEQSWNDMFVVVYSPIYLFFRETVTTGQVQSEFDMDTSETLLEKAIGS